MWNDAEKDWRYGPSPEWLATSGAYYIGVFKVQGSSDTHAVVMWRGMIVHDPSGGRSPIYGVPKGLISFHRKEEFDWAGLGVIASFVAIFGGAVYLISHGLL
jgi:hypothetical protein